MECRFYISIQQKLKMQRNDLSLIYQLSSAGSEFRGRGPEKTTFHTKNTAAEKWSVSMAKLRRPNAA